MDVYVSLTVLYAQHFDFKKFFDVYHSAMIEFPSVAMRIMPTKICNQKIRLFLNPIILTFHRFSIIPDMIF